MLSQYLTFALTAVSLGCAVYFAFRAGHHYQVDERAYVRNRNLALIMDIFLMVVLTLYIFA